MIFSNKQNNLLLQKSASGHCGLTGKKSEATFCMEANFLYLDRALGAKQGKTKQVEYLGLNRCTQSNS